MPRAAPPAASSPRGPLDPASRPAQMGFRDLPAELRDMVAAHLPRTRDLASLSEVDRYTQGILAPRLRRHALTAQAQRVSTLMGLRALAEEVVQAPPDFAVQLLAALAAGIDRLPEREALGAIEHLVGMVRNPGDVSLGVLVEHLSIQVKSVPSTERLNAFAQVAPLVARLPPRQRGAALLRLLRHIPNMRSSDRAVVHRKILDAVVELPLSQQLPLLVPLAGYVWRLSDGTQGSAFEAVLQASLALPTDSRMAVNSTLGAQIANLHPQARQAALLDMLDSLHDLPDASRGRAYSVLAIQANALVFREREQAAVAFRTFRDFRSH